MIWQEVIRLKKRSHCQFIYIATLNTICNQATIPKLKKTGFAKEWRGEEWWRQVPVFIAQNTKGATSAMTCGIHAQERDTFRINMNLKLLIFRNNL